MGTGSRIAVWAFIGVAVLGSVMALHEEAVALPAGWTVAVNSNAWFYNFDGKTKIAWRPTERRWFLCPPFAATGVFAYISAGSLPANSTGAPVTFIGDGAWRDLGNGLYYKFFTKGDFSIFAKGGSGALSSMRLLYNHTLARWSHTSESTGYGWIPITHNGVGPEPGIYAGLYNTNFAVDLGNKTTFRYDLANDCGVFSRIDAPNEGHIADRFRYFYSTGQWEHKGRYGGWFALGTSGLDVENMADALPTVLNNNYAGFQFAYDGTSDFGIFMRVNDDGTKVTPRLRYDYKLGVWIHRSAFDATWNTLAFAQNTKLNIPVTDELGTNCLAFAGWSYYDRVKKTTVTYHASTAGSLGNHLRYAYGAADDSGYFWSDDRKGYVFKYAYTGGVWYYARNLAVGPDLSASGCGSAVLNGSYAPLKNGWYFRYMQNPLDNTKYAAVWSLTESNAKERFMLPYNAGGMEYWHHRSGFAGSDQRYWFAMKVFAALWDFPGKGAVVDWKETDSIIWKYCYYKGVDRAWFYRNDKGRFIYDYAIGMWRHVYDNGSKQLIRTALSADFLGGCNWDISPAHYISIKDNWYYAYSLVEDMGYFLTEDLRASARFRVSYAAVNNDVWFHKAFDGNWYYFVRVNRNDNFARDFDGFKEPISVVPHSFYHYDKATNRGIWESETRNGLGGPTFYYDYGTGMWQHQRPGASTPFDLGMTAGMNDAGTGTGFMGDGASHQLDGANGRYRFKLVILDYTDPTPGSPTKEYYGGLWYDRSLADQQVYRYLYAFGELYRNVLDSWGYWRWELVGVQDPPRYTGTY